MAFNPYKGFYVSTVIFDAPWDEELENLETRKGEMGQCTPERPDNIQSYMKWLSFRSKDGNMYTKPAVPDKGEVPEDYQWTSLYYDNPILKSIIDWFPVEKTRVRLAEAKPHGYLKYHYDWDNKRHGYDVNEHQTRIWIQLTDTESWYRLSNGDCDVHFKMVRGQFAIIDTDCVLHATENRDDNPRRNILMHAKTNFWVKNITELFPRHTIIDPRVNSNQPH